MTARLAPSGTVRWISTAAWSPSMMTSDRGRLPDGHAGTAATLQIEGFRLRYGRRLTRIRAVTAKISSKVDLLFPCRVLILPSAGWRSAG
jgi:hypothetical protein